MSSDDIVVPFTIDEQFRMSEVKRWHVINTAREQTLADHSFQVCMILNHFLSWSYEAGDMWTREEQYFLLCAGLLHDAHEVWMGDRPTCAKEFAKSPNAYVTQYRTCMNRLSERRRKQAENWLKLADTLEALVWLNQNGVGPRADAVVSELLARMGNLMNGAAGVTSVMIAEIHQFLKQQGVLP